MNARGTREVDEEMDEPRVEKKGERGWERGKGEGEGIECQTLSCTHTFVNTSPAESSALARPL